MIENGHNTNFWIDPWLNGGRLKDCHGARVIYDMGMGDDIKVSRFIQNDGWHFLIRRSHDLMDIFQDIPNEIVPWSRFDDEIVWTLKEHGQLSLKSSYNLICNILNQQLQWTSAIWFKGSIKKPFGLCLNVVKRKTQNKEFPFAKTC